MWPTSCRTLIFQSSSAVRLMLSTLWLSASSAPFATRSSTSARVSAPKSTSVPAVWRVAAMRCLTLRFLVSSGVHSPIVAGSSEYSMPSNSGWSLSAS